MTSLTCSNGMCGSYSAWGSVINRDIDPDVAKATLTPEEDREFYCTVGDTDCSDMDDEMYIACKKNKLINQFVPCSVEVETKYGKMKMIKLGVFNYASGVSVIYCFDKDGRHRYRRDVFDKRKLYFTSFFHLIGSKLREYYRAKDPKEDENVLKDDGKFLFNKCIEAINAKKGVADTNPKPRDEIKSQVSSTPLSDYTYTPSSSSKAADFVDFN